MNEDSKKFMATLVFSDANGWKQGQQVDANTGSAAAIAASGEAEATFERLRLRTNSPIQLAGPDSDSLQKQLQALLKQNTMRDSDFYNLLVMPLVKGDVTQELTKDVFIAGLTRLGYCGPPNMLVTLFKKIDTEYACQPIEPASCHDRTAIRLPRLCVCCPYV